MCVLGRFAVRDRREGGTVGKEAQGGRLGPKLALAGLSLAAALAAAEAALRSFFVPERFFDPRMNAHWESSARGLTPTPLSPNVEPDPQLGWRMRRNYRGENASHNSRGFRGAQEFEPRPTSRRIVAIGDSFTYGFGVGDDATYAERLGGLLHAEVVNAGANGYGVDQALLMWEHEGRRLHPDTVVLGYVTDDFHRNALALVPWPKPRFRRGAVRGGLVYEPPPEPGQLREANWRPLSLDLLRLGWRQLTDRLGFPPLSILRDRQDLSERLLARLQSSVSETGARLVVLIIGHCAYPHGVPYEAWIAERIAGSCGSLGLACIDFTEAHDPSLYAGCHWNEEGHRRAARRIAAALRSAG